MKKILACMFLIGLVTQVNLFAMNEKQEIAKTEKAQISKKDYAKVVAAAIGAGWFSVAALTVILEFNGYDLPDVAAIPLAPLVYPLLYGYFYLTGDLPENVGERNALKLHIVKTSGALAGILASGCGLYLYKKLAELRMQSRAKDKISNDKVSIE